MCNIPYNNKSIPINVILSKEFDEWLEQLPPKMRGIVAARLGHICLKHFGDHKHFDGLIELRWKNGLRVYTFMWNRSVVIALCGGNKNGQNRDIKKAQKIKKEYLNGTRPL